MKYVALVLLLANLGYFAWGLFFRPPAVTDHPRVTQPRRLRDPNVDPVRLLAEEDVGRREEVLNRIAAQAVSDVSDVSDVSGDSGLCTALGPFQDVFGGEALLQRLTALDVRAELTAIDQPTGRSDYRVLLPPARTVEEAFRKLRELKSRDIDSYIISEGDSALGISLGVFSTPGAAERVRDERERQGYPAQIAEIRRFERQFWLLDTAGQASGARLDAWETVAEGRGDIALVTRACPAD